MNQLFSREMQLVDVIGGRVHLTLREVLDILTRRASLLFFAIALLALSVTDPPGLLNRMPIHVTWVVWVVALSCYLVFYVGLLALGSKLGDEKRPFPIYLPLVSILALLPAIFIAENLSRILSGTTDPILFDRLIFDYLSAQSFELVFLRFVLPLVQTSPADAGPTELKTPAEPMLRIGEKHIPVDQILHMSAQEHYVRVTHLHGSTLHRARLSDLIDQTASGDGCQPHRSWWVSRHTMPVLQRHEGRHALRLSDGTIVPVARGRLTAVREWLAPNAI